MIVTGSRLPYLGRTYYVHLITQQTVKSPVVSFNHSAFKITVPPESDQKQISAAIQDFYKRKAVERLTRRVKKLAELHGLDYKQVSFRTMQKGWGSCTADNNIILNPNAMKLSYQLIDYLIIHELVHTKIKDHSKKFWSELAKHVPEWKRFDEKIAEAKF